MRNVVVGQRDPAYDDLHAAEVLLTGPRGRGAGGQDDVAVQQRAGGRDHLDIMRVSSPPQTQAAQATVSDRGSPSAAAAVAEARRAQPARQRRAAPELHQRENKIRERILAAARRAAAAPATATRSATAAAPAGCSTAPVAGPVTSPFGYRVHPIYHYWGLHDGTDFGAGCGTPLHAAAGGR